MKEKGRIKATPEQWHTFITLPPVVQDILKLYIKKPTKGVFRKREQWEEGFASLAGMKRKKPSQENDNENEEMAEGFDPRADIKRQKPSQGVPKKKEQLTEGSTSLAGMKRKFE